MFFVDKYGTATYDLNELQALLRNPNRRILTRVCVQNAVSLGYSSEQDIVDRILKLRSDEIYKTMESNKIKGLWQDVYLSDDGSRILYIKLQKSIDGKGVVIQLKER